MRYRLFITLILIISTLVVFWPTMGYDFVNWDDGIHIYENPYLNPATIDNALHFWQEPYKGLYIPVTYTLWSFLGWLSRIFPAEPYGSAQLAAGGLNPYIFHTANLILHLLNTLIVFSLLRLLLTYGFKDEKNERDKNHDPSRIDLAAGLGALVFALHPVQVEPVAWATGMKDVLSGTLSLLAVREYFAYSIAAKNKNATASMKNIHYVLASVMYVFALLSKPAAVVVPLVALILDRWAIRRPFKDSAVSLAGWFIAAGVLAIVTITAQQTGYKIASAPLWARPFIAGDALSFYLYKLIWPMPLGIDYGRTTEFAMQHWWIYATWLFPFTLALAILLTKKREPWIASFGIFAASLLPVLGLVPFAFQNISTVSDRYLYFPMLGVSFLISWIFFRYQAKLVISISILVIVMFGIRSASLISTWANETELYLSTLKTNPASSLSHNNLGVVLAKQGKLEEAIIHYKKALQLKPSYANAHNNLGVTLAKQDKLEEAIIHYKEAVKFQLSDAKAHNNLGVVLAKQGKLEEAIIHYKKALQLKPSYANAHNSLGVVLAKQDKLEEAVIHYQEAIKFQPGDANTHNNLGVALAKQGKWNEAAAHYKKALKIKPSHAKTRNNLGVALAKQGKWDEAITHYQRAIKLHPDNSNVHYNLGVALDNQEKSDEAVAHYKKALEIKPAYTYAHKALGIALAKQGKWAEAIAHYQRAIELQPNNASAHYNLGLALDKQGKWNEAIAHYQRAIELQPNNANVHNNLGIVLVKQGKSAEAVAHYKKALEIKPADAKAHNNLGVALAKQGKWDEAIAHYQRIIQLQPDNASVHYNLGIALSKQGKYKEAISHFSQAVRLRPDFIQAKEQLETVSSTLQGEGS